MTLAIQTATGGAGAGTVNANLAAVHLGVIANLDTGIGLGANVASLQPVTYAQTDPGVCPTRLNTLVNTNFGVNATADIVVLAVGGDFVFGDNSTITSRAGTALPVGNALNPSTSCLVVYDTSDNNGAGYCVARNGAGGAQDLSFPASALLYHELSHALRIVTTGLLQLTAECDPASPEESAAITDENDMRTQLATLLGEAPALRDPNIHCGGSCGGGGGGSCCIVASVATGSPMSSEVGALRAVRDRVLRRTDVGFAFFRSLHHAYYSFSPQIATWIAADQRLRETVRTGFVEPLVRMLRLIEACVVHGADDSTLAGQLRDALRDRGAIEQLDRAAALCAGPGDRIEALDDAERRVAELLDRRALPDPHVSWALVEPVRMYQDLLGRCRLDASDADIAAEVRERIDGWSAELPLDDDWGSCDVEEVHSRLASLDATLLRSPCSRRHFRGRLDDRYGHVTAVRQALAAHIERDAEPATGGTHG